LEIAGRWAGILTTWWEGTSIRLKTEAGKRGVLLNLRNRKTRQHREAETYTFHIGERPSGWAESYTGGKKGESRIT